MKTLGKIVLFITVATVLVTSCSSFIKVDNKDLGWVLKTLDDAAAKQKRQPPLMSFEKSPTSSTQKTVDVSKDKPSPPHKVLITSAPTKKVTTSSSPPPAPHFTSHSPKLGPYAQFTRVDQKRMGLKGVETQARQTPAKKSPKLLPTSRTTPQQTAVSRQTKKSETTNPNFIEEVHLDLSTQTGFAMSGGKTLFSFKLSSGRPGMDTPNSPPQGWIAGEKKEKRWSTKYQCWMENAINIGAKDTKGDDDGDFLHEGRIPKSGYPAAHGCVRLESTIAKALYKGVEPGKTRIHVKGSVQEYLAHHFDGYKLLEFGSRGEVVGFKRNPDGSLTDEFMKYVASGKIDYYKKDRSGKPVDVENAVLAMEMMDNPWTQGVPVSEYRKKQRESDLKILY